MVVLEFSLRFLLHQMGASADAGAWQFFFFQAEDGIRDYKVTGVQTCALPISFSKSRHSAGERDKATNAEIKTETAMVMANCWYNLPTMPGINPTGIKTEARIKADRKSVV